jgi:hypothetical protein
VSLLDTDHIWGVGGNAGWVWKSFLRGHNPIFMDPWDGSVLGKSNDPQWEPIRRAMGDARLYAARVNLARLAPAIGIASSAYCLADPGREYLAYLPEGGTVKVDLSPVQGEVAVEWFDAGARKTVEAGGAAGGAPREFKAPFNGPAVLYLKARPAGRKG